MESEGATTNMYNPTEEHGALRQMVRQFAEQEVDPQRAEYNEKEQFNRTLFARCGELGLLGVTADESCGGSGMDAVAACVVSEELSAADPAFALSYLAHAMLYVNNVNVNASEAQKRRWLPGACDGSKICAMATSGVPRPRRLSRDFGREEDTIMHLRETLAGKRTKIRERRAP